MKQHLTCAFVGWLGINLAIVCVVEVVLIANHMGLLREMGIWS